MMLGAAMVSGDVVNAAGRGTPVTHTPELSSSAASQAAGKGDWW